MPSFLYVSEYLVHGFYLCNENKIRYARRYRQRYFGCVRPQRSVVSRYCLRIMTLVNRPESKLMEEERKIISCLLV